MSTSSQQARIVPLVVACPIFLQNIETSVMTTALPSIAASLDVHALDLNLAITAYLLSLAVFLPVSGWLTERFGARRIFCGAILLFSIGSALCGAATSLEQLVAFRVLQGMGGALMMPVGRLILLRSIPVAQLVNSMIWFTVPGALGRMLGPLLGGVIVTMTSWRWIFLINVPFGILGVAMALKYIKPDAHRGEREDHLFDVRGFILLATGLACLLGAVETIGRALLPSSITFAIGCLGLTMLWFYVHHSRSCINPLIDLKILRIRTYRAIVIGALPLRVAIGASPFLLPLMLQLAFGLSPLQSGLLTVATAVGSLSTRTVVAYAIRKVGFRKLLMMSAFFTSLFYIAYGLFTPNTPHVLMFGVMLVGGLCNSMAMVALQTLGYSDIPPQRMSHATTMSSMAHQVSISLGVVIGTLLLTATSFLYGRSSTDLRTEDFASAFTVVGVMTLISIAAFRKLKPEDGAELRDR